MNKKFLFLSPQMEIVVEASNIDEAMDILYPEIGSKERPFYLNYEGDAVGHVFLFES